MDNMNEQGINNDNVTCHIPMNQILLHNMSVLFNRTSEDRRTHLTHLVKKEI
jgi:hypothetical protein